MRALIKTLITTFLIFTLCNSISSASTKWKNGDYLCTDPVDKLIVEHGTKFRTYQKMNFRIKSNSVKMLNGALDVYDSTEDSLIKYGSGTDRGIKTKSQRASFSIDKRSFGFILEKKNTDGISTHLVRFMPGNQVNITSKAVAIPLSYIKTVNWQASCQFTKTSTVAKTAESNNTTPKKCVKPYNWATWNDCIGTTYDSNGFEYTGSFKNGKRHGEGKQFYDDSEYYIGEWKGDKIDGKGSLINSETGVTIKGTFKNGQMVGRGTMTTPKYILTGGFKNNKLHGKCSVKVIESGVKISGMCENGEFQFGESEIIKKAFNSFDNQGRSKIQESLTELKYYKSSIDGDFGPGTEKALKAYFKENNLTTTDQSTIKAHLENLLNEETLDEEIVISSNNLPIGNLYSSYLFAKVIQAIPIYISETTDTPKRICKDIKTPIKICKNVDTPVKTCQDEQVPVYGQVKQNDDAAANALIGAIMGGITGNAMSNGDEEGAAVGALMGGLIGAAANSNKTKNEIVGYKTVQSCKTVTQQKESCRTEYKQEKSCKTENIKVTTKKIKNYKITYDFHGERGKIFTNKKYDAGENIPLNVNIAAQLLINDVDGFLEIGVGLFGLEFSKKYASIREIKNGAWNLKLENIFNDFQSYVYQNEDFKKYADNQKTLREEKFNAAMGDNKQELTELVNTLRTWLQTNLTHQKANEIYDLVDAADAALDGNDLSVIRKSAESLLKASRELNLTQKSKILEEVNKAERKITEAIFGNFDASGRMAIQKALGDLGFFKLPIDGKYSTGTHLAIKEYMKSNDFKSIENKTSVEEQLTLLVPTNAEINSLSVAKNKMSEDDQWNEALLFMKDIQNFVAENPSEFEFEFVKKYKEVRGLENKLWDTDKKNKFSILKKFVSKNEKFKAYIGEKQAERSALLIKQLDNLRSSLERKENDLKIWLQKNLLDNEADNVLVGLQQIQSSLKGQSLDKLNSANKLAEKLIEKLGIIRDAVEKKVVTDFDPNLLISDVENFVKNGIGTFGLEFSKKYAAVREIKTGSWNLKLESAFNDFQTYVLKNSDFKRYSDTLKATREELLNDNIGEHKLELKELSDLLKTWLQTNLLHEKADEVYDKVAATDVVLNKDDLTSIQKATSTIRKLARELNLTENSMSLEERTKSEMAITENVFNEFDSTGRLSIQKALGDLQLFKLPIDGTYSTGMHLAIKKYVQTKDEQQISNETKVKELLSILLATNSDSNNLSKITTKISEEQEWQSAKIFMRDLEDFVSIDPTVFDFDFVIKYKSVKNINDAVWDADTKSKFLILKDHVLKIETFRDYWTTQNAARDITLLDQLTELKSELENYIGLLKKWLQNNLLDDKAEEVLAGILEMQTAFEGNSLDQLKEAKNLGINFIKDLNLQDTVNIEELGETKYNPQSIYIYVNLTENAKNIYTNLQSNLELENDYAKVCVVGDINNWDQFSVFKKLKTQINLKTYDILQTRNCNNSDDIYIITGSSMVSGQIPKRIDLVRLKSFKVISRADILEIKKSVTEKSKTISSEVLSGIKSGYGLFYIAGHPTNICSNETKNLEAHNDVLMRYNDVLEHFSINFENIKHEFSLEQINRGLQGKTCGVVYGSAENLKILANAFIKANIYNIEFLPIWIDKEVLKTAVKMRKADQVISKAQTDMTKEELLLEQVKKENLRTSQEAEKEKLRKLKQEQEEELKTATLEKQRKLRLQNNLSFTALIDRTHPVLSNLTSSLFGFKKIGTSDDDNLDVNLDLKLLGFFLETIITQELADKRLEGWKLSSDDIKKIDYGQIIFKKRKLEAIIVEFIVSLKNIEAGVFKDYCKRIHIAYDQDFDFFSREAKLSECNDIIATDQWKTKNGFESGWLLN